MSKKFNFLLIKLIKVGKNIFESKGFNTSALQTFYDHLLCVDYIPVQLNFIKLTY